MLAALLCVPKISWANTNDLQVWRLGSPNDDFDGANGRFRLLSDDLGLAITPTPMHPGETLGRSGASMEIGLRVAQIHDSASIEGNGSCLASPDACRVWVNEGTAQGRSSQTPIDAYFLIPTLQVRKGLPFSFEFETKFQYLTKSELFAATGGLRWSLNEGFAFLPDLSVGGQGTRLMGDRNLGITTAALDVTLSKSFGIGGLAAITPYAGWQRVWISSVSEVIDFDPANEAIDNPTADDTIFQDVLIGDNYFDRFFLGFRFISYIVQVSGEITYLPALKLPSADGNPGFAQQGSSLSFAMKLGLDF